MKKRNGKNKQGERKKRKIKNTNSLLTVEKSNLPKRDVKNTFSANRELEQLGIPILS